MLKWKKNLKLFFLNLLVMLILLFIFLPLLWLFLTSIKPAIIAFKIPPVWDFKPTFDNYIAVINNDFFRSYLNSLIVATGTTCLSLVLGIPGAYLLSRYQFKGKNAMGTWVILIRMAPPVAFILPLYLWLRTLGLINSYLGLIITYLIITLPLCIWILRGFFESIPIEIEESASIDGCSKGKILIGITIPLALPGIITCAILSFIMSWNEFLYALILSGTKTRTAPIMIQGFITFEGINWGQLAAAGVLVTLPAIIFTMIVRKGFIKGLMMGSVKA